MRRIRAETPTGLWRSHGTLESEALARAAPGFTMPSGDAYPRRWR